MPASLVVRQADIGRRGQISYSATTRLSQVVPPGRQLRVATKTGDPAATSFWSPRHERAPCAGWTPFQPGPRHPAGQFRPVHPRKNRAKPLFGIARPAPVPLRSGVRSRATDRVRIRPFSPALRSADSRLAPGCHHAPANRLHDHIIGSYPAGRKAATAGRGPARRMVVQTISLASISSGYSRASLQTRCLQNTERPYFVHGIEADRWAFSRSRRSLACSSWIVCSMRRAGDVLPPPERVTGRVRSG